MKNKFKGWMIVIFTLTVLLSVSCTTHKDEPKLTTKDREDIIPEDVFKVTPENDDNYPRSHSDEYHDPVPLPYPINTAGAEDSAFILPDGKTLYFWFTPDVRVPPEKQIIDGVTGIYVSYKSEGGWSKPERVLLQEDKKLALDGAAFVSNNTMWFCSAREGYVGPDYSGGLNWFNAFYNSDKEKWENWKLISFSDEWEVGELHIFDDELYYHSSRQGGKGGLDIWMLRKDHSGNWSGPENVEKVNTERDEGYPALSPNGNELWISRDYGLWRALRTEDGWSDPELMISPLAGEASIDAFGNVYFTHHFFKDDKMIEADIYVAYKK